MNVLAGHMRIATAGRDVTFIYGARERSALLNFSASCGPAAVARRCHARDAKHAGAIIAHILREPYGLFAAGHVSIDAHGGRH